MATFFTHLATRVVVPVLTDVAQLTCHDRPHPARSSKPGATMKKSYRP